MEPNEGSRRDSLPPPPETAEMEPPIAEESSPEAEAEECCSPAPSGDDGPAPGAADGETVTVVDRLGEVFDRGLQRLRSEMEARWARDRFREEQVDRLHAELQQHKNDLLGRTVQPVLQGVIRLHEDLEKTAGALRQKEPETLTPERFFGVLDGFREDLELLLERHGVTRFEHPGETFEPARQTALRTEPASRSDLAGRIVTRLRPGFEQGTVVLRKEGVAVWTASAEPDTANLDTTEAPGETSDTINQDTQTPLGTEEQR